MSAQKIEKKIVKYRVVKPSDKAEAKVEAKREEATAGSVSYTHLTLPTILLV